MTVPAPYPTAAVLEHLTGPSRGHYTWITAETVDIWLDPDNVLCAMAPGHAPTQGKYLAQILREGDGFRIAAVPGAEIWVDREPVQNRDLAAGDTIEFGETGPLSRLRIYDDEHRPKPDLLELLGDTASYLRSSRRSLWQRFPKAIGGLIRRIATDGAMVFRLGVISALLLLASAVTYQYLVGRDWQERVDLQVESVAAALSDTQKRALHPGDLALLEQELQNRLQSNAERLLELEERSTASTRVVQASAGAVAFLQGGYGLRHKQSGQMLRQVLDVDGLPRLLPNGQPYLSLEGDGPLAEVQFNGTGFVLKDAHVIVTNRHVAIPWEDKPGLGTGDAMEPVLTRFLAYFPGRAKALELTVTAVSDRADVALVTPSDRTALPNGLVLSDLSPLPGQEVLVMGYPTGLMSLLARSGEAFVAQLRADGQTGFWDVAARLAAEDLMWPLSSRGIVGQITDARIVYDAETTHGGSGGPVLNLKGEVVAVNTAIIPEFGGSNLGVPVAEIRALLSAPGQGK